MPGPPFLCGETVDLHAVVEADAEFIARGRNDPGGQAVALPVAPPRRR